MINVIQVIDYNIIIILLVIPMYIYQIQCTYHVVMCTLKLGMQTQSHPLEITLLIL